MNDVRSPRGRPRVKWERAAMQMFFRRLMHPITGAGGPVYRVAGEMRS